MDLTNPIVVSGAALAVCIGTFVLSYNRKTAETKKDASDDLKQAQTSDRISEKLGMIYPYKFGEHYKRVYRAGYREGYHDGKLDHGGFDDH